MRYLMDHLTLAVFSLFSGRLRKRTADKQYEHNIKNWPGRSVGFIERQSGLDMLHYGRAGRFARRLFFHGRPLTAAENSCEVIAVYNALLALGQREELPELLKAFSQKGICAGGIFGTAPAAMKSFFQKKGYRVEMLRAAKITKNSLKELSEAYEVFIFSAFNRGHNPFYMVHSMCVSRDGSRFIVHNDGGRARPAGSLSEAVLGYHDGAGHPICVLGIAAH